MYLLRVILVCTRHLGSYMPMVVQKQSVKLEQLPTCQKPQKWWLASNILASMRVYVEKPHVLLTPR